MTVGTFDQPDFETQGGTEYKTAIDNSIAVVGEVGGAFAPHEQSTPVMTVRVDAGRIFDKATPSFTEVAAQSTGTITAPASNPRKDIVYIDASTGTVGVATGSEAASPSDPAVPSGKIAIARVTLATSTTSITNQIIEDLRTYLYVEAGAAAQVYDAVFFAGYDSTFTKEDIAVQTYAKFVAARAFEITGEQAALETAPTGAALIFDFEVNGTTVYTTKPQFAATSTTLTAGTLKTDGTEDVAAGDVITFKITGIGSTEPGEGLTVALKGTVA